MAPFLLSCRSSGSVSAELAGGVQQCEDGLASINARSASGELGPAETMEKRTKVLPYPGSADSASLRYCCVHRALLRVLKHCCAFLVHLCIH